MMFLIGFMAGLAIGAAATTFGLPRLTARVPAIARLLAAVPSGASGLLHGPSIGARIDAEIAEIERQIKQGLDRERNAIRLAVLRDIRGE